MEQDSHQRPEWLRVPAAVRCFGLSRSTIYELIQDEKIKSKVILSKKEAKRGVRLISFNSLNQYIENQV